MLVSVCSEPTSGILNQRTPRLHSVYSELSASTSLATCTHCQYWAANALSSSAHDPNSNVTHIFTCLLIYLNLWERDNELCDGSAFTLRGCLTKKKVNDNLPSRRISNLGWRRNGSQLLFNATAALRSPTGQRNSSFRQTQQGKRDELANFLTYSISHDHIGSVGFPTCWEEVYRWCVSSEPQSVLSVSCLVQMFVSSNQFSVNYFAIHKIKHLIYCQIPVTVFVVVWDDMCSIEIDGHVSSWHVCVALNQSCIALVLEKHHSDTGPTG